jgi:hypothetical protein
VRNKSFASIFLTLSIISNFALPAFADQEIMVLPPVGEGMELSSPAINYQPALLKGTVTTLPVGTSFEIITNKEISSQKAQVGEIFSATLNQPVSMGGDVVIPAGSEVFGQVTYSEDAGRLGKNANMEIRFNAVKPPYGKKIPMMGKIVTKDNSGMLRGGSLKSQLVKNTTSVAVTTTGGLAVGMGVGAIAGETGVGAAVGSAAGGVVGLGYIVARKGKDVKIPLGTKMIVKLEQPLTVGQ